MGPLVPDIIGLELNFIVALVIGIGFGYILEQAGFSSTKKLVGLFYGYDFTVLRVFFTAGVTAMIGVIALDHFGLLDMEIVYVNPTFLYSALVGGLIMGIGFVIGGFCPGTSFCAAAIGKKDGMVFVLGSFLGVFLFTEMYPLFSELYIAENWGFVRIFDTLGVSQALFAFGLTVVALAAFWGTTFIEYKVNKKPVPKVNPKSIYVMLTGFVFVLGVLTFLLPPKKQYMMDRINDAEFVSQYEINNIDSDELAFRFMKKDASLQLFDLREKSEFDSLSLPNSINMEIKNIFDKDFQKTLSLRSKINVFLASTEEASKKAAVLASELGFKNVKILKGGFEEFQTKIMNFEPVKEGDARRIKDTNRFRKEAQELMPALIADYKKRSSKSAVPKKSKRVLGGC